MHFSLNAIVTEKKKVRKTEIICYKVHQETPQTGILKDDL